MAKVIIFSKNFPSYHNRKGEPTLFVEKFIKSVMKSDDNRWYDLDHSKLPFDKKFYFSKKCLPKHHTIRSKSRWKVGDKFSPRIWSDKPYRSKQIQIAPDIEIKKIWQFEIAFEIAILQVGTKYVSKFFVNGKEISSRKIMAIAENDGLSMFDFMQWFQYPCYFQGQIICWNEEVNY